MRPLGRSGEDRRLKCGGGVRPRHGEGGRNTPQPNSCRRLTEMGLPETEGSVTVKINKGAFPAWFYFAAMKAVGTHTVRLHEAD